MQLQWIFFHQLHVSILNCFIPYGNDFSKHQVYTALTKKHVGTSNNMKNFMENYSSPVPPLGGEP